MARKILLADDSVTAQNMGRKILADAGYEVYTVNNGSAALKKVAESRPDVIVLDVYMPGYSGLEVCQRLKEASETSRIPILLTVGKLEPFKPEEAKRARADAFIVKPFEASELLSALSKLEDKIVPRPEPAKPGRFARAIAAVEEGRYDKEDLPYDKSMAVEEDSSWKERIVFPSKKKKSKEAEPEEVDDPALYNPVNKDLRTVVEHKPAHTPRPASPEDTRVDLAALSLQGLPKDVTPQEIAALAAAAAQITGSFPGAPDQSAAIPLAESQPAELAPKPTFEDRPEPKAEDQPEAKPEKAEIPQEAAAPIVEAAAEPKAEEKEKVEAPADKPSEAAPESRSGLAYPASADLTGAIVALPLGTYVSLAPNSGTGSGNGSGSQAPESEPATMAVAAGAESAASESRWMAVPVALLPEEAAISLEQEMHKAYAAFAAAEAAHAVPAPGVPEAPLAFVEPAPATEILAPFEAAVAEPVVPIPEPPAPEPAHTVGSVVSEVAEAVSSAVKEFVKVAASYVEEKAPAAPEPAPVEASEAVAQPAPEAPLPVEAKAEPVPVMAETAREAEPAAAPKQDASQPTHEEREEQKQEEHLAAAAHVEISATIPETLETPPPALPTESPADQPSPAEVSSEMTAAAVPTEPAPEASPEVARKESEITATTEAAWASWRRIRQSGDKAQPSSERSRKAAEEPVAQDRDEAAMAVAAGAEKAPEEAPAESESDDIANIVDSVLADMRPKIVQEISRKLGKKKKK